MSIAQAHLDIARERFLELMADSPQADAYAVARTAIKQADDFAEAYEQHGYNRAEPTRASKLKGCRACHGSGGKQLDPCKVCAGTGTVAA